jgi:hypothetical protein
LTCHHFSVNLSNWRFHQLAGLGDVPEHAKEEIRNMAVRNRPWPDEAWMTPEQLADAKAKREAELAAIPRSEPFFKEEFTEAEEDAFYARYDRGMAGAVIAHRSPPASQKRRE